MSRDIYSRNFFYTRLFHYKSKKFFTEWEAAAADFLAPANLFQKKLAAANKFENLRPRKQELVGRVFQVCSESAVITFKIRKKNWN